MKPMRAFWIQVFHPNLSEAAPLPDDEDYSCFNAFFTRKLTDGVREISLEPEAAHCIRSPCDGTLSEFGQISNGTLIQAKGQHYELNELLLGKNRLPQSHPWEPDPQAFARGSWLTAYLAPRDYHRVHMPLGGKLLGRCRIPGRLYSVNDATAQCVDRLYCRNARTLSYFKMASGEQFTLIMVGALIVGRIRMHWDQNGGIPEGNWHPPPKERDDDYQQCSELGLFEIGSTAIIVSQSRLDFDPILQPGTAIKVGEKLAQLPS